MKKFFSLMLAVLLLVSALPFAASAAAIGVEVRMIFEDVSGTVVADNVHNVELTQDGSYAISEIASRANSTWTSKFPGGANIIAWSIKGAGESGSSGADPYVVATNNRINIRMREVACTHASTTKTTTGTCTTGGVETVKCNACGKTVSERNIAAAGHTYDNGVITTPATCAAAGVKTFTCTACGATKTEAIAKLTEHSFTNNICTVCNLQRYVLNFFNEKASNEMKVVCSGDIVTAPTAELVSNYEFKGWYEGPNGYGRQFTSGSAWRAGDPTDWYAWYVYNPNKDGMSTITVTARCYIDKIGNSYLDVPVLTQALPDNTNVFDWLQNNKNTTILSSVYNKVDTTKYEWKNRYFYNHNGTEVLTEQTVFADGPKAILIKLEEKDNTTRANVQLYLHTSTTAANPFRILDMNGYTSGMNVTRNAAANLVKEYYSYKNIGNLFTEADWNALQNGENVAGRTSVYISDNGTYKIHVVVTNASSKSSSNADPNNPKTGDYITIAVGTMVMAAAAFITLAEMKKRKMI